MEGVDLKIAHSKNRDQDLWDNFRNGSKDAFSEIYNKYAEKLILYLQRFSTDQELVEECIQEFFVELWFRRQNLSSIDHISNYLYKSVRRKILRLIKKQQKRSWKDDADSFELPFETLMISSEENLQKQIAIKQVTEQLSQLEKEIIYLKYYQDNTIKEITYILNLDKKVIYNALGKAMIKFRKLLHKPSSSANYYIFIVGGVILPFV